MTSAPVTGPPHVGGGGVAEAAAEAAEAERGHLRHAELRAARHGHGAGGARGDERGPVLRGRAQAGAVTWARSRGRARLRVWVRVYMRIWACFRAPTRGTAPVCAAAGDERPFARAWAAGVQSGAPPGLRPARLPGASLPPRCRASPETGAVSGSRGRRQPCRWSRPTPGRGDGATSAGTVRAGRGAAQLPISCLSPPVRGVWLRARPRGGAHPTGGGGCDTGLPPRPAPALAT